MASEASEWAKRQAEIVLIVVCEMNGSKKANQYHIAHALDSAYARGKADAQREMAKELKEVKP